MVLDARPESTKVVPVPEYIWVPVVGVVGAVPVALRTIVMEPDPLVQEMAAEFVVAPEKAAFVGADGGNVWPQALVCPVEYAIPS